MANSLAVGCQAPAVNCHSAAKGTSGIRSPYEGTSVACMSAARCRVCRNEFEQLSSSAPLFAPLPPLRKRTILPSPRAEVDQDTVVAIGVGLAGLAVGIGIPVFYEMQVKGAETRENDQPCFACNGTGSQSCRFCTGVGNITVELGGGEREVSSCINCEGRGAITCTTCQGSGIQPRYLDRREFKDDD